MTDQRIICDMYRDGMGGKAIAKLLGCNHQSVYDTLHREGVKLRYSNCAPYVPTQEEIEQHKHRMLKQRGIVLETGMLSDAH